MNNAIAAKLTHFVSVLEQSKSAFQRPQYRLSCERAIQFAKAAISTAAEEVFPVEELQQLSRYVSDSLPWNEDILRSWEPVQKELDKKAP